MGRSTAEIMEARRNAEAFHADRFGVEVEPFEGEDELFDVKETPDGKAQLEPAYQNPAVGYTAYVVSGRAMPNVTGDGTTNLDESRTGKVRDGGWHVRIKEPMTLHGSYGGSDGVDVDAPTTLAYGHYNIKLGDEEPPIVIRFESNTRLRLTSVSRQRSTVTCSTTSGEKDRFTERSDFRAAGSETSLLSRRRRPNNEYRRFFGGLHRSVNTL